MITSIDDLRTALRAGHKIDASGADLHNADLSHTSLIGADLTGVNLSGASLTRSSLRNADFTRADLRNADFTRADLRGAYFWETNMLGAKLDGVLLDGAKLDGADLIGAKFGNYIVSVDEETIELLLQFCRIVNADSSALTMETVHMCDTAHHPAGWICALSEKAKLLEGLIGWNAAACLVVPIPEFTGLFHSTDKDEKMLKFLKKTLADNGASLRAKYQTPSAMYQGGMKGYTILAQSS
jgi:hypothetical protein